MKRFISRLSVSIFCLSIFTLSWADPISDNLKKHLDSNALDGLAKDLGAMIAGGSFHQGKALGFPLGFDVGAHANVVGIHNTNPILRDSKSRWGGVFGQAEVGLPFDIDVIGRGGTLGSGKVWGGGLRYGVFKPSIPLLPAVSVEGLYNQMTQEFIDVKEYSVNAVVSVDVPFVHPYVGGGYDYTKLDPTSKAFDGTSVSTSLKGQAHGYRLEGGVNLSMIPFTYLTLGAGLANGESLYHLGLGAKF